MNVPFESQFDPQESSVIARAALGSVDTGARASVVNRTHRVVRQRAKVMQARRSHVRGLMVPLILCSILLILTAVAVWSGLYQSQAAEAAEAVQADVVALATSDANNHFLVMLLWFVPVSIAVLGTIVFRRFRGADHGTAR
jgi:hypothetical protein